MPAVICTYLLDIFFEIGPTSDSGMSPARITEVEIRAWQDNRKLTLLPWEVTILRRLSVSWLAEGQRAEDPAALAPWAGDVTPAELRLVAGKLRGAITKMAA